MTTDEKTLFKIRFCDDDGDDDYCEADNYDAFKFWCVFLGGLFWQKFKALYN